jgi:hypothetical protein
MLATNDNDSSHTLVDVKANLRLLVLVVTSGVLMGCDLGSQSPQLANGWVTNCSGVEFSKFSPDGDAGPGPSRPVFRLSDQLVLAVPKENWPSANRIWHEPWKCRTIRDLPEVHYIYFVIRGDWSGSYDPQDVPVEGGRKEFLPDAVTVRIEREPPDPWTPEDRHKVEQILGKFWDELLEKREVGGLMCGRVAIPNQPRPQGGLFCSGHRTPSDPDTIILDTKTYSSPFVLIDAGYPSKHYGGIHVYWNVWTLDVARARDIDQAVWKSLKSWNLLEKDDSTSSPR